MSEPRGQIDGEKGRKGEIGTDKTNNEAAENPYIEQIVSAIEGGVEQLHAQDDENNPNTKWDRKWRKGEVFGIWAAAIVGLIAIIWSVVDSIQQRGVMQDTIVEMQAEQRPWVSLSSVPELVGNDLILSPSGEPKYATFEASFRFRVKNTGKLPAANVDVFVALFDALLHVGFDTRKQLTISVASKIDSVCKPALNRKDQYGFSLFPGDDHPFNKPNVIYEQPDFQLAGYPVDGRVRNRLNDQHIMLAGCIDYRFPNSARHHQTPFAFALTRKGGKPFSFEGMPGESYPVTDLELVDQDQDFIERDVKGVGPIN